MNHIKIFRVFGILTLISLYFLILVGGVVRATGSGMGCPDWPKCFGHYLPPSQLSEVSFKPNFKYGKKVFIIYSHKLYFTKSSFVSGTEFSLPDWQEFEEHNYTEFNATHTWIEAINRYVGVFVGLFVLGLFIYSYILYKKNRGSDHIYDYNSIMKYSLIALVFVVIQAVIGKYLVASNLKLKMLTVHMLFSYAVLFAVIYVLYNTSRNFFSVQYEGRIFKLIVLVITLTGIQTILGTQVTANVEQLLRLRVERGQLVENFGIWFYLHRSFSILLLLCNGYLVYIVCKVERNKYIRSLVIACFSFVCVEALFGILLNYFNYPKTVQPLHLLFGTAIAGFQLYLYIIYQKQKQSQT